MGYLYCRYVAVNHVCIYIDIHNDVYLVVSSQLPSDSGAVMGAMVVSTFPGLENPRAHGDSTNNKGFNMI